MVDSGSLPDELRQPIHSPLSSGVSVVIITHNRPQLLRRALESVRTAGAVSEIVVVDNASTDETPQVCESLPEIKYVRIDRPQTLGAARNVGLISSHGEYVTFLDDDDTRLAGSLARQLEILKQRPEAGFVYGCAIIGDAEGRPTARSYPRDSFDGDIFWRLVEQNSIPSGSVVYRRAVFSSVGLFDDRDRALGDWDMCVRISEIYPIAVVSTPVIIWRQSAPDSRQITSDAAACISIAVNRFRHWMKLPRAVAAAKAQRRTAWRSFSLHAGEHLMCEAARALRRGLIGQSFRSVLTLVKLGPSTVPRIILKRWRTIMKRLFQPQPRSADPQTSLGD